MEKKTKKEPKGIGGWLILPTIGLFIGLVIWGFSFIVWFLVLIMGEIDAYGLVLFLMSIIFSVLFIVGVVFEFQKRKQFPRMVILILWLGVAASILLALMDGDFTGLVPTILGSILWTWYFNVSKRVKNTFIN